MGKIANAKRREKSTELAKRYGVHPVTIRRLVSLPRDQYLAESLSKTQPWKALGISRATWYRRGKPMPESCNDHDHV